MGAQDTGDIVNSALFVYITVSVYICIKIGLRTLACICFMYIYIVCVTQERALNQPKSESVSMSCGFQVSLMYQQIFDTSENRAALYVRSP